MMMLSVSTSAALHPLNLVSFQKPLTFPSQKLTLPLPSIKPFSSHSHLSLSLTSSTPTTFTLRASSDAATTSEEEQQQAPLNDASSESPPQAEKLGVVVKPTDKPRLVLKFIWMEKNIGIALDQMIPGHGTIPLSPYYFWPRKDAWEELRELLEGKPWISQKQMIILLNQATDIINLWQQSGGNLA